MSVTDPATRRPGIALLLVLITMATATVCALSLWRTAASAARAAHRYASATAAEGAADSLASLAAESVRLGTWRAMQVPGHTLPLASDSTPRSSLRSSSARLGWALIATRGQAALTAGAPHTQARAETRLLIPLAPPMPMPTAALTGGAPWITRPGAVVSLPPAPPAERICAETATADSVAIRSWRFADSLLLRPPVDPDTVTDTLRGFIRLTGPRLTRPLNVVGMLALDSDLMVEADLFVSGVVVVRGSVVPSHGRMVVIGAVLSGDVNGTHSELGSDSRVRYDACAVRRALDLATTPVLPRRWTRLRLD